MTNSDRKMFEYHMKSKFQGGASFEFDLKTNQYVNPFVQHAWLGWSVANDKLKLLAKEIREYRKLQTYYRNNQFNPSGEKITRDEFLEAGRKLDSLVSVLSPLPKQVKCEHRSGRTALHQLYNKCTNKPKYVTKDGDFYCSHHVRFHSNDRILIDEITLDRS